MPLVICFVLGAEIMEKVNAEFGITSAAHGTVCAVPIEKAYKI